MLRVRHFKPKRFLTRLDLLLVGHTGDLVGDFVHWNTVMVPSDTRMTDLPDEIEGLEKGDIVYFSDFYNLYDGDGKWTSLHPDDERVQGLYAQAVQAERKAAGVA